MDLVDDLQLKQKQLDYSVKTLRKSGKEYAKAYQDYRVALAKELLRLKNDGMAVTIAYDIARGDENVARLKFQEISAEAIYKANLESINAKKLEIKIIENQIQREWGNVN